MKTLVTGGTGWIGRQLVPLLDSPVVTSRDPSRAQQQLGIHIDRAIAWDSTRSTIPVAELPATDAVINLMGDSIADGRWTKQKRQAIRETRVAGTANLVKSLLDAEKLPSAFVTASAIGYYGDCGDTEIDESSAAGNDFLSDLCVQWERAAEPLVQAGVRVVWLRIGIVLGRDGGAMDKMLPVFRKGLGGKLGSGRQWMSWIHMQDLLQLILRSLEPDVKGPVNAVAPQPVTNSEFTKQLGLALGRPAILTVPKLALKLALGEFANFLTASQRVLPKRAGELAFPFRFPDLQSALKDIVG